MGRDLWTVDATTRVQVTESAQFYPKKSENTVLPQSGILLWPVHQLCIDFQVTLGASLNCDENKAREGGQEKWTNKFKFKIKCGTAPL